MPRCNAFTGDSNSHLLRIYPDFRKFESNEGYQDRNFVEFRAAGSYEENWFLVNEKTKNAGIGFGGSGKNDARFWFGHSLLRDCFLNVHDTTYLDGALLYEDEQKLTKFKKIKNSTASSLLSPKSSESFNASDKSNEKIKENDLSCCDHKPNPILDRRESLSDLAFFPKNKNIELDVVEVWCLLAPRKYNDYMAFFKSKFLKSEMDINLHSFYTGRNKECFF